MTKFYSDAEHLSKCSPVTLHLSPGGRILNANSVSESTSLAVIFLNSEHFNELFLPSF